MSGSRDHHFSSTSSYSSVKVETRNRRVLRKEDLQVCDKFSSSSSVIMGFLFILRTCEAKLVSRGISFYESRSSCLIFELEKLEKNRTWIDETWERGSHTVEHVAIGRSLTNEATPFSKGIAASLEQSFLTFRRFLMKIWSVVFKVS